MSDDEESDSMSLEMPKNAEELVEVNEIQLNVGKRRTIFMFLVIIHVISSFDGGIIPQQNKNIKSDFESGDVERVGLFSSIDSIGRVIGGIGFTIVMSRMNRKILLISTLIFKGFTLIMALFTPNYYVNVIFRCFSGISQVFYTTYFPVWCDQYGRKNRKAIMITIVQLGNPVGLILGYGLGKIFESMSLFTISGWRGAFGFQGILMIICAIIVIFFFDKIFFSEKFVLTGDSKGVEEEEKIEKNKSYLLQNLFKILSNKIYLFLVLSNTVISFEMGILQYFGDTYMELVLGVEDSARFVLFIVLCLIGPVTGLACGGIVCQKLGGYVTKKSMYMVIILMIVDSVFSMLIACHKSTPFFAITSLIFLFCICACIPPLNGIIIASLDHRLRGDGFALCNCVLNLLGSFPSSYIYALIADGFKSDDLSENDYYKSAMMVTMVYNFVGLFLAFIGGRYRLKISGDLTD